MRASPRIYQHIISGKRQKRRSSGGSGAQSIINNRAAS